MNTSPPPMSTRQREGITGAPRSEINELESDSPSRLTGAAIDLYFYNWDSSWPCMITGDIANTVCSLDSTTTTDFDWRDYGALSPVGMQGCGDCYIWSAVGISESSYFLQTGANEVETFSKQEIVSCWDSMGEWYEHYSTCQGGYAEYPWIKIAENGGIVTEETYPYDSDG